MFAAVLRRIRINSTYQGGLYMDLEQAIVLEGTHCDAGWNDSKRGRISWRTLFSAAEPTPTN